MRQSFEPQTETAEVTRHKLTLTMVSDFNRLESMHRDWDTFLDQLAPSPFFLLGLLRTYFSDYGAAKEWRPIAFVMSEGDRLLGLAAFRTADDYVLRRPKLFRSRRVEFLLPDLLSPDFVARQEYLKEFVGRVMPVLFDRLGCQSARMTLPSGSPSALLLRQWGRSRGMTIRSEPGQRHAVLNVVGTWQQYLNSLGRKHVQNCERLERRLDEIGKWDVRCERVDSPAVVERVLEVERNSWKQRFRDDLGRPDDQDLKGILDYYRYSPGSRFCPLVWLLELNGKPVAFASEIRLGGVAYQPKASFDESFSDLSPGKILDMKMFQALFESGSVSRLEFFTFYDYMRQWNPEVRGRETIVIENHGALFKSLLRKKLSRWATAFRRAAGRKRGYAVPREEAP